MPDQYNVKNPPLPDRQPVYRGDLLQETVRADGTVQVDGLGPVGTSLSGALPTSQGGGSSSLTPVRVPFAFGDADLLTGKTIYTPTAGDRVVLAGCTLSITTAFNGTTPVLAFGPAATPFSTGLDATAVDLADTPVAGLTECVYGAGDLLGATASAFQLGRSYGLPAVPLLLTLSDGAAGDPGSTQGAGEVILMVIPA